jgi:phospholipase/lecithinase/hemolysin
MKIKLHKLLTVIGGTAMAFSMAVQAQPFSTMVEFSGALSDTGNYVSTHANDMPAPFVNGTTTNGPVAGEVMAQRLGLQVKTSMHLVGPAKGNNFAVRDALAGRNGPDDLQAQLDAYFSAHDGKADPRALYFVFNGGNDVILAVRTPDDQEAHQVLVDAVGGLETALRRLSAAGARTIFAPDFVDIGLVPAMKNGPISARATRISNEYNTLYYAMLDRVQPQLSAQIIRWSFGDFFKDTLAHAHERGFTNTTDACTSKMKAGECDLNHFLFVNGVFPTARFHRQLGEAMAQAVLEHAAVVQQASK